MKSKIVCFGLALAAVVVLCSAVMGQEILLDKGIKAGELQVFPVYGDPMAYYYVPDKARLATGEDGKPMFSFMKFVSNVESKPGAEESDEGEGGGIVHCVVQLGVTDEQLEEARSELSKQVPGAKIVGPVIFRSGKFGIVSTFKQDNGDWTTKVLGMGSAPILDGEKAAVSIRLTKQGAKILWQNFKMAVPDISFTFEMEIAGYRNPYEAKLEADFDQIYKHRDFSAAFASSYLGFQIRDVFDDLKSSGAIKLTAKGDDSKLDALIASAYGKICDLMFDKMETGAFAPEAGGTMSLIDKASAYLSAQRAEAAKSSGITTTTPKTGTTTTKPVTTGGQK